MFTPERLRAKAAEFAELAKTANDPEATQAFQHREHSFTALANNEQWLADRYDQTIREPADVAHSVPGEETLVTEDEHILRCLGAALIMQWNTLPAKLQRELFDNAGSMGALLATGELRGQIARFLHRHKDDEVAGPDPSAASDMKPDKPEKFPTALRQRDTAIARWENEGGATTPSSTATEAPAQ